MKISVDMEGKSVITELVDLALKVGGIQNMAIVQKTLQSMEVIVPETPKGKDKTPKNKPPRRGKTKEA